MRAFGYADGPLFDRRRVSAVLLDEFIQTDVVRQATRDYAAKMMVQWKAMYPGKDVLRLANNKTMQKSAPEFVAPPAAELRTEAGPAPETPPATYAVPPKTPQGSAPAHPSAKAGAIPAATQKPPEPPVEGKAVFILPNAKSGEPYRAVIEAKDERGNAVSVLDARLPADLGLVFDAATVQVHGTPLLAGDHAITVQWQDLSGAKRSGSFLLIVNPNPRDLWKSIDADASDPYFKPNEDWQHRAAGTLRMAAGSKRGRSHAHAGTFRDDDFFIQHLDSSGWTVLIVADGAGSAKSSRKGAQLAANKAGSYLAVELGGDEAGLLAQAFAEQAQNPGVADRALKDRLYNLFGKAAWAALRAIEEEAASKAFGIKEYSTTLLCAVHRKTDAGVVVGSFWVGDGAICAYGPAGRAHLLGKPDGGEFAGQTRFLDRAVLSDPTTLWNRVEFSRHESLLALMLMTDGISDPRFETDNGLQDASKWDALWTEIAPALAAQDPGKALVEWMDFFTPGHHDDRTFALLW